MSRLRVTLDGTPLLGRRTGVGRYVHRLLGALRELPEPPELAVTAFTVRNAGGLADAGVAVRRRPVPARLVQTLWTHLDHPALELLAGRCDVFHGTNFVLPPSRRAIGVVTVHDLSFLTMPETVTAASLRYRLLVPRSIHRAELILVPSTAVRTELLATYPVDPEAVRVTPLGVDPSWFDATPPDPGLLARLGLPARYLLFVGTREPRKNLALLLAAHRAAVATGGADVPPLVLVGPPGWGEELRLPADVLTPGYVGDEDLRRLVAGATALAMPSRAEGFGLPVLEALATGTAVLAADIPVLHEVGGDACRYAAPSDADAWAGLLVDAARADLRTDAEHRQAWARQWTWRRTAELTLDAYAQAAR